MITCGVCGSAFFERFDTIIEFNVFHDLISLQKKGNKIKRVENHKIKVTIEVDIVCRQYELIIKSK